MLKFLLIPSVGLILTAGTFFYEDFAVDRSSSNVCDVDPGFFGSGACPEFGDLKRGFPIDYIEKANTYSDGGIGDNSFDFMGFFGNFSFWTIIAGIGYFVFRKIRNIVGTVVLAGLGIASGLVYFGILVV